MSHRRILVAFTAGAVAIAGLGGLAGARGGVNPAAGGLRSPLALVGGEDPSIPANATLAAADARFTGTVSKVSIAGMQATRFPVSARNQVGATVTPCVVNATLGGLTGSAALTTDAKLAGATAAVVSWSAPSSAGANASIDIVCDWTDKKGVVNHHETHWAGTL